MEKEIFLSIGKAFGLELNDPHMEELFVYVQKVLPNLKRIEELDLTGFEPFMPHPSSEDSK
ncbi:MAG: hypothetical protein ACPL6D_13630 [Thermodesulfobacteriota bacterium]